MEWVIGIIVFIVLWRIFTSPGAVKAIVEREILDAYRIPNDIYYSTLMYERYRDYAISKGEKESIWDDGSRGVGFDVKLLNGKELSVIVTQNRRNGKANVSVEEKEIAQKNFRDDFYQRTGIDLRDNNSKDSEKKSMFDNDGNEKFKRLIHALYTHENFKADSLNYKIGKCFEDSIDFISYEDDMLSWRSNVNGECQEILKKAYPTIKMIVFEIFGSNTRIYNAVSEDTKID